MTLRALAERSSVQAHWTAARWAQVHTSPVSDIAFTAEVSLLNVNYHIERVSMICVPLKIKNDVRREIILDLRKHAKAAVMLKHPERLMVVLAASTRACFYYCNIVPRNRQLLHAFDYLQSTVCPGTLKT